MFVVMWNDGNGEYMYIYIYTWFSNVLNMFDHLPFLLEDHIVSYADVNSEQINQWNSDV